MKAGYCCERSGVMDQELLDSHHKKPRSQFPKLQYELDNGECLSLLWHAFEHRRNLTGNALKRPDSFLLGVAPSSLGAMK